MRALLLAAALVVTSIATAACSGGGGGGDDDDALTPGGTLTSGTYHVSKWHQVADECALLNSRNGEDLTVTVTGTALVIGLASGVILDSNLAIQELSGIDFNTDPFGFGALDCVVDLEQDLAGLCLGNDVAGLTETADVSAGTGTQCTEAEAGVSDLAGASITFPCHSELTFRITKTGP